MPERRTSRRWPLALGATLTVLLSLISMPVPGRHKVTFRFLDDHRTTTCDRNLRLNDIELSGQTSVFSWQSLTSAGVEVLPDTAGEVGTPERPWDGVATLWNNGSLSVTLDSQLAKELGIWFTAAPCAGWTAHVRVELDGEVIHDGQLPHQFVGAGGVLHGYFELDRAFPDGTHTFTITMSKDLRTPTCDRNLVVTELYFRSTVSGWYSSDADGEVEAAQRLLPVERHGDRNGALFDAS